MEKKTKLAMLLGAISGMFPYDFVRHISEARKKNNQSEERLAKAVEKRSRKNAKRHTDFMFDEGYWKRKHQGLPDLEPEFKSTL